MLVSGHSRASEQHPERNEDAFFALANGAMGVFDGLGGHPGSAEASRIVRDTMRREYMTLSYANPTSDMVRIWSRRMYDEAQESIREAHKQGHYGIATTAITAYTLEGTAGYTTFFNHIGDSRGYLYRDSNIVYTTLDHAGMTQSLPIDEQYELQERIADAASYNDLGDRLSYLYRFRNIISVCIDGGEATPTQTAVPTQPGDVILLTSDGIHDNLTTKEIYSILKTRRIEIPELLVTAAIARSREGSFRSKPDDMTAVVHIVE